MNLLKRDHRPCYPCCFRPQHQSWSWRKIDRNIREGVDPWMHRLHQTFQWPAKRNFVASNYWETNDHCDEILKKPTSLIFYWIINNSGNLNEGSRLLPWRVELGPTGSNGRKNGRLPKLPARDPCPRFISNTRSWLSCSLHVYWHR